MSKGIGMFLLNIAVAGYLFATGIMGMGERTWARLNPEIRQAVEAIFGRGDFSNVLVIILSIIAIIAGILIVLRLFNIGIPMLEFCLIICAIVWIVFIVMINIIAPLNSRGNFNFIQWLRVICPHIMVLAGIMMSTERFGGR